MKRSTKNILLILLILAILVAVYYFYTQSNQEQPIDGKLPVPELEDDENVKPSKTAAFKADFNLPFPIAENQVLVRPFYTLSYNKEHAQADWVAYKMFPFPDSLSVKRKDAFRPDPLIEGGSATLGDYKKSGYDRGHLAPAKALSFSKESMSESFYMSNMSPQVPMFNRGIWRFLEAQVYSWSKESDSLYVVTGPVLNDPLGTIGDNEVSIPHSYYKTIVRFKDGNISGIGFLLKNEKSPQSFFDFVTSIDSVEQATGIDFYAQFPEELQNRIEANKEVSSFAVE
jgi:endonuclease G